MSNVLLTAQRRYASGRQIVLSVAFLAVIAPQAVAQEPLKLPLDGRDGRQLLLENFRPQSMLKVDQHSLTKAKFPVVDVHAHFFVRLRHSPEQLDAFVKIMDRNNVAVCVSLDGTLGDKFDEHQEYLSKYADRFVIFANIDFQGAGKAVEPATWDVNRPDFARRVAVQLADAKERGAAGLKLFKQFGLAYKNADGSLIAIDDRRFDPIWQACGELALPVLIHTADPAAFFLPIDEKNERWEELHRRPEWSFYGERFPQREELLAALNRVIERHPRTNFIGAHVANNAEDLKAVGQWLDKYPNLYVEIASRISELGRQPYTARAFFLQHQDRILFGTDGPWPEERLRLYWRFLETYDEYFPYSEKEFPPQGLWNICGIGLPDEVLRKVYYENAQRLVPGVREKLNRQKRAE
ncbi:MAG TPA: amidohydrolase family protein [Pirellulaceae bacterium]|nr:amidohydrolase family protein [Pirellulaceae bacterium]